MKRKNLILQFDYNVIFEMLTHTYTESNVENTTHKQARSHMHISNQAHMDIFTPALVIEIHCWT